jgi:3-(3-hydroxy-phenyl)propionate hydroxylase
VAERDVDVVVAGFGPVGATVTALLANAGLSVLAVDRDLEPYPLPRAVATDDDAIRVWQTIGGLDERLVSKMIREPQVSYRTIGGREFARVLELARSPSGHPGLAIFYQPWLEREIGKTAVAYGNAELRRGVELVGFEEGAGTVDVTLRDLASGSEEAVTAGWLLGCDGASSSIRRAIGAEFGGSTFEQLWIVTDLKLDTAEEEEKPCFVFNCDPQRPTVTMPMPGQRRRWEFMLFPGETGEEMLEPGRLAGLLADAGQDPGYETERAVVYTFHARVASDWGRGRVYLLGDSAHVTPPFAGQGMNAGVRDAGNIWWKIAAVERGAASEAILETYEAERRRHTQELIDMAVRLGSVVQTVKPGVAAARDRFFGLVGAIPTTRRWIESGRFKPDPRIRGGLLGRRARPFGIIGRQVPQPVVTGPDGEQVRLDDFIGPRFALISSGPDPWAGVPDAVRGLATGFGVVVLRIDGGPCGDDEVPVEDPSGELAAFLRRGRATKLLVRPDRFVYGAWR